MDQAAYIDAVSHAVHERYSPYLHKWLAHEAKRWPTPLVTAHIPNPFDGKKSWLAVGWRDDDGWFMGSGVKRILCDGRKAESYAYSPKDTDPGDESFWTDYLKRGRCAIDPEHATYFRNADHRFSDVGDIRTCNWCGQLMHRVRWTEIKRHERWDLSI